MMVSTTVITDPLQEIEVDLPRLGSGEESFPPHSDEMQGEQSSFDGPAATLVSRWGSSFSFSGCSVMSHVGTGLSVSRITTGTQCF